MFNLYLIIGSTPLFTNGTESPSFRIYYNTTEPIITMMWPPTYIISFHYYVIFTQFYCLTHGHIIL